MRDTDPGRPGAAPDDDHLGRLLSEGLGRQAGGPVDEAGLLAGARRGAARRRRRRTTALRVAVVLALGLPAGAATVQVLRADDSLTSAGSVASAPAAGADQGVSDARSGAGAGTDSAAGGAAEAGSAASASAGAGASPAGDAPEPLAATSSAEAFSASEAATPGPGVTPVPAVTATAGTRIAQKDAGPARDAAGRVIVPADALLTARDLPQAALERTSDRSPAPSLVAVDTCGTPLTGLPEDAGSRAVVDEQRTGVPASGWLLGSSVRVYAADGAARHLAAAGRLGCTAAVPAAPGTVALAGHGRPDARGRVHWYGVVAVGRTVAEVRVVVPSGAALTSGDLARLLRVAAGRVTSSGLAASVDADPALG